MAFITQLSNTLITYGNGDIRLISTPDWDRYVSTTLKKINESETIEHGLIRQNSTMSQDLEEDIMLMHAPRPVTASKPEDVKASEESTTPGIRKRALNVKSKLLGMDEEVRKPTAPALTPGMNPVYPCLQQSSPS